MALSELENSRFLVMKNHQCMVSSITDARREGGSRSRGVVHTANVALSSTPGLLVEDHVHLPLVAFIAQWGIPANIERLDVVVEGIEQ
jgi:hypothetical protein